MIRPILATIDPYKAAELFQSVGWEVTSSNPPQSGDPLVDVALFDNHLMLGTQEERYVSTEALAYLGSGVVLYLNVPEDEIERVYRKHMLLKPSGLQQAPWGDMFFHVEILGYRFMIAAKSMGIEDSDNEKDRVKRG